MKPTDDGTRHRIINAAGEVFAQHGFEKGTIRDIVSLAEVNLAAVNYHFGDKWGLYQATVRYGHELAGEEVPLPSWEPDTPADIRFRDFVRTMLQRVLVTKKHAWHSRLMMRELIQPTDAGTEVVREFVRPMHQLLLSILDELLPPETPQHRRDQTAFSLIGQCLFYKIAAPVVMGLVSEEEFETHFTQSELADHIADVMLAAMGHRKPIP